MLRLLLLLFFLPMPRILATPVRTTAEKYATTTSSAAVHCHLPSTITDAVSSSFDKNSKGLTRRQFSLDIAYIRLTMACFDDEIEDLSGLTEDADGERGRWGITASLSPIRPSGQRWPPTLEASVNNAHFALAILNGLLPPPTNGYRSSIMRLRRLSIAGLPLPGNAVSTRLITALTKFSHLTHLNLCSIGATSFPSELLSLTRLRSLLISGNPIDCHLKENQWIRHLIRLDSRLFQSTTDALLLGCENEYGSGGNASSVTKFDVGLSSFNVTELDSPVLHSIELYGSISVPCSRRFFRIGDAGIWTPEVSVTWRRLEPTVGSELLLLRATGTNCTITDGNNTMARVWHPNQHHTQLTTRVGIGPLALGAPLVISGVRLAAVGLWRCELAKAGLVLGVRHRLTLRPPLESLEINCYIVAACTSFAMVLIGLIAALVRCLVRTRCSTRIVHIVEAQSVHNLDASPLQTRRRRQAATEDVSKADGDETDPWLEDDLATMAAASGIVAIPDGPSGSGVSPGIGANGLRDRLRDINNQMRLRATNFGEVVGSSVRAGWSSGVEHVKEQMRSMAEFCGVANLPLGQTVSVVSVYTDPEGRQEPMECHLHLLSSV